MKHIAIITIILLSGCPSLHWNYYYPYCKVNPEKFHKNLPDDYEDCLSQFDTVLSNEVISYFKTRDSAIASIEISQELGGLFINFWNLGYYRNKKVGYNFNVKSYLAPLATHFYNNGIEDPEEMMRILFKCYHKKLNKIDYDWNKEINLLKSYWISAKIGEGWVSPAMKKRENEILVNYHFQELEIKDTVDVLYNKAPRLFSKSPDWYYLSGIIQFKIPEEKSINVKLINIESELKKSFIPREKDTIFVGDTLTDYSKGWLKRGRYYFNYHTNKEYRD